MKKITARITMSVDVSDEIFEKIVKESLDNPSNDYENCHWYEDYMDDEIMELFKKHGYIDEDYGDSYIPGPWIEVTVEGYDFEVGK